MRSLFTLLILIITIGYFWHSAAILPLKWLVVFLHESSHAIATIVTGGTVKSLSIVPEQGGQVISVGGNRFVILSAGYCMIEAVNLFLFNKTQLLRLNLTYKSSAYSPSLIIATPAVFVRGFLAIFMPVLISLYTLVP